MNNEGIIVVRFVSKVVKDSSINNVKSHYKVNNPLTAKDIYPKFSDSKIYSYINYQLTHHNNKILKLAKEVSEYYNYKYTWANVTEIFVRRQEDGQIFEIENFEVLQKMDVDKKISAWWK